MAFTAADLTTIDAAIASGAVKVRFSDGREVQYGTIDHMLRARAMIAAQVSGGTSPQGQDPLTMVGGVTYADFTRS